MRAFRIFIKFHKSERNVERETLIEKNSQLCAILNEEIRRYSL